MSNVTEKDPLVQHALANYGKLPDLSAGDELDPAYLLDVLSKIKELECSDRHRLGRIVRGLFFDLRIELDDGETFTIDRDLDLLTLQLFGKCYSHQLSRVVVIKGQVKGIVAIRGEGV